jgi:hypothetical protein
MTGKRLLILAAVVIVLGGYILVVERHQPTTDELKKQESQVFPGVERDDVVSLEVTNPEGTFRLEKREDEWFLTSPLEAAADTTAVGGALTSLLGLESERTLRTQDLAASDLARYGLESPEVRVELGLADGSSRSLAVGAETALGSNRAVSRDPDEILLCSRWFAQDLERGLDGWRSKIVVQVYPNQVASFEIASAMGRTHLVQAGDQWRLLEPIKDLADRDRIRDLISKLNAAKVEEFISQDDGADLVALGLASPRLELTIVRTTGDEPVTLELGTAREVDGARQVACRRNGGDLLWISDEAEDLLDRPPTAWRSTVLLPFDTWDVERLELSGPEGAIDIERRQGMWYVLDQDAGARASDEAADAGGSGAGHAADGATDRATDRTTDRTTDGAVEADSSAVTERLGAIAKLRAIDLDLAPVTSAEIGTVVLHLSTAGTPSTVELRFQQPMSSGGNVVATATGRDTVMSVSPEAVAEVLGDLDALRAEEPPAGNAASGGEPTGEEATG